MGSHALIVTPYKDPAQFTQRAASRLLLQGLDELGIRWTLHQPWTALEAEPFDVIVCWSYGYRTNDFPLWARRFEDAQAATGIPVVNSARYCMTAHRSCLTRWAAAGVPCARVEAFTSVDEVSLDFPLILRVDGQHQGRDVHLARDSDEARQIVAARELQSRRPLDLAIEYIDTRHSDRLYRKWRSYVVGGRVLPRTMNLGSDWRVNVDSCIADEQAAAEDLAFCRDGDPHPELLVRAASALDADVIALDYHRHEDGRYTFFEGNRHFLMAGDHDPDNAVADLLFSRRSAVEWEREDAKLSRLLGRLVADRMAGSDGSA